MALGGRYSGFVDKSQESMVDAERRDPRCSGAFIVGGLKVASLHVVRVVDVHAVSGSSVDGISRGFGFVDLSGEIPGVVEARDGFRGCGMGGERFSVFLVRSGSGGGGGLARAIRGARSIFPFLVSGSEPALGKSRSLNTLLSARTVACFKLEINLPDEENVGCERGFSFVAVVSAA